MLESARMMLEFDINPEGEAQLDPKGEDSDWESLSFAEQQRLQTVSPEAKKKQTYRAMEGKALVQTPDWKAIAMTSFNFEDNSFRQIREEIDQLQRQYPKLEYVTKEACKLLGDHRPWNICKELENLQQKDAATLEATNATLALKVADLEVALVKKDEEICQLQTQSKEGLDRIRELIGNLGDVLNKARLFNNDIKTEGQL